MITDGAWLRDTFIPTVGKRGAEIIAARGVSSAGSAANALIDHVKALTTVGPTLHSIAVYSDGSYGFAEGIWAGMPVRTTAPGTYTVDKSFTHDEFAKGKIARDQRRTGRRARPGEGTAGLTGDWTLDETLDPRP